MQTSVNGEGYKLLNYELISDEATYEVSLSVDIGPILAVNELVRNILVFQEARVFVNKNNLINR